MSTSAGTRSSSNASRAERIASTGSRSPAPGSVGEARSALSEARAAAVRARAEEQRQNTNMRADANDRNKAWLARVTADAEVQRATGRLSAAQNAAREARSTRAAAPKTPAAAYRSARRAYSKSREPADRAAAVRARAAVEAQRMAKLQADYDKMNAKYAATAEKIRSGAGTRAQINRMQGQLRKMDDQGAALLNRISDARVRQLGYQQLIARAGQRYNLHGAAARHASNKALNEAEASRKAIGWGR